MEAYFTEMDKEHRDGSSSSYTSINEDVLPQLDKLNVGETATLEIKAMVKSIRMEKSESGYYKVAVLCIQEAKKKAK